MQYSGFDISFKDEVPASNNATVCFLEMTEHRIKALQKLIINNYWYQVNVDGLSARGQIGEYHDGVYEIFTHKKFDFEYNGKQIIRYSVTDDKKQEISIPGLVVEFTYEVHWRQTNASFSERVNDENPTFTWSNVSMFSTIVTLKIILLCCGLIWLCIRWRRSSRGMHIMVL